MKYINIIFTVLSFVSFGFLAGSCERNENIDYCKLLQEDQRAASGQLSQEANNNTSSPFLKNFNLLLSETVENGFPVVSRDVEERDSCKYWAIAATFIHTAKTSPEVFFSKRNSRLFGSEMQKGNLDREFLVLATNISFQTITFCDSLRPVIGNALNEWGMMEEAISRAKFKKCYER